MQFIFNFSDAVIGNIEKINATVAVIVGFVGYLFARQQFRFQSLHQKRLEIIEIAYEKIKVASRAYLSFVLASSPQKTSTMADEKGKDFVIKINEMVVFLDSKRLFFTDEEKNYIDLITETFSKTWAESEERRIITNTPTLTDPKRQTELFFKNLNDANKEIPKLIKSFEQTFKKALGF